MKLIYLVLGCLTLGLGCVGLVFPILPTTPFFLVAAFAFGRSSNRLNCWFKHTKLYQNNLDSFVKGKGMTVKTKVRILVTVTLLLAIAAYSMRNLTYGVVIIACVWLAHIIGFVFCIKTTKEDTTYDE